MKEAKAKRDYPSLKFQDHDRPPCIHGQRVLGRGGGRYVFDWLLKKHFKSVFCCQIRWSKLRRFDVTHRCEKKKLPPTHPHLLCPCVIPLIIGVRVFLPSFLPFHVYLSTNSVFACAGIIQDLFFREEKEEERPCSRRRQKNHFSSSPCDCEMEKSKFIFFPRSSLV